MDSVSSSIVPARMGVEKAEDMGKPAESLTPGGLRGGPEDRGGAECSDSKAGSNSVSHL